MKRLSASVFALLIGFGASIAAFEVSEFASGQGSQGTKLGDLDFTRYCVRQFGPEAVALSITNDIYGWRCSFRKNDIFAARSVDTDAACAVLHGSPAYANAYDSHFPASWQCFRGRRP